MHNSLKRSGLVLAFVLALWGSSVAQNEPDIPVLKLLAGPERADMPWKVDILRPPLMYQQLYLIQFRAQLDAAHFTADTPRHLYFVAKLQDASGKWLDGEEFNQFEIKGALNKNQLVQCAIGIYVKPGDYTLGIVAYDSATRETNVLRRALHIPALSNDSFPDLDSHLPLADFPNSFPADELSLQFASNGELFPIATGVKPFVLKTKEPVRIDLVLNVSKHERSQPALSAFDQRNPYYRPRPGQRIQVQPDPATLQKLAYQFQVGSILQVGSLLGRMEPENGCVRLSVVDALRMRSVFDQADAKSLDWNKVQDAVAKLDQNTIDARVLANKKGPGLFIRDYIDKVAADSRDCGSGPAPQRRYIIVVSQSLELPEYHGDQVSPADAERATFYFLHRQGLLPVADNLGNILKPAKPRKLDFNTPTSFRKTFAEIIGDIQRPTP